MRKERNGSLGSVRVVSNRFLHELRATDFAAEYGKSHSDYASL